VKQIALTEKQVKGVIAASKDIDFITDNAGEDIGDLKPETIAKLDVVARRNGRASYAEYLNVSDNIGLVIGGYDTVSRKYVGKEALTRLKAARIRADRKMSATDKKEALDELSGQLPLEAVEHKGNIPLVVKYADQLSATSRGD
jgi:hypothetical protein